MSLPVAAISGSILDIPGVKSQRVKLSMVPVDALADGNNAHLGRIYVETSSTKPPPAEVPLGRYAVTIGHMDAGAAFFADLKFNVEITGDTSWAAIRANAVPDSEWNTPLVARLVAVERASGEVTHGNTTGALTLDARDGGHLLTLTGDTTVTFSNEPGARTVYLKVTGTGTLTVEGVDVDYSDDPLVVCVYAGGEWLVRTGGSSGPVDPGLTPATPAFPLTYVDNTTTRTYTIPTTTGVDYKVGGVTQTAGVKTASASETVTVTPVAQSGYTLTSGTVWTHTFVAAPAESAADVILADSPLYYLPMKDAPGTTAVANLGTGTVPWTNTAAVFDGEKANLSAVNVTHIAAANTTAGRQIIGDRNAITIAMTVICGAEFAGGNIFRSPDSFTWAYGTGGSVFNATAASAVTGSASVSASGPPNGVSTAFVGVHHITYTYDGTTQKLYFDGTQVASSARTGPIVNNGYDQCFIGGRNPYFETNLGNIAVAHFEVNAVALSAGRIAAHAAACIADLS